MGSVITVNSTDAYHAACVAGLGIIQATVGFSSIAAGEMVEILPLCTREIAARMSA